MCGVDNPLQMVICFVQARNENISKTRSRRHLKVSERLLLSHAIAFFQYSSMPIIASNNPRAVLTKDAFQNKLNSESSAMEHSTTEN